MTPEQWARVFRAAEREVDRHPNPDVHLSVALWRAAAECEVIAVEQADAAEARTEQDKPDTDDGGGPLGTSYSTCRVCNTEIMRYPDGTDWTHGDAALDVAHLAWKTPGHVWLKQRPPRP